VLRSPHEKEEETFFSPPPIGIVCRFMERPLQKIVEEAKAFVSQSIPGKRNNTEALKAVIDIILGEQPVSPHWRHIPNRITLHLQSCC
jgi:hypothetical protein